MFGFCGLLEAVRRDAFFGGNFWLVTFRYPDIPVEIALPDRLALRMLVRTFRPELMDRLVDRAERRERRRRLLPAQLMMYFALAMWLFGTSSYEEVLAKLTGGLPELFDDVGNVATAAAIARARMRLGVEPLKGLCAHVAASAAQPGAERVFVLESVAMEAPDTPANRGAYEAFGAAYGEGAAGRQVVERTARGRALDVWLVSLTECRLRLSAAAAVAAGPQAGIDSIVADWQHDLLGAGALVVGEQDAVPLAMWDVLAAAGAQQIWRVGGRGGAGRVLPVLRELPDGSYLSVLPQDGGTGGAGGAGGTGGTDGVGAPEGTGGQVGQSAEGAAGRLVRVVPCRSAAETAVLVTSFLDEAVTAAEIAARHRNVAEMCRSGVGAFVAQLAGMRVALRSKSPELVQQEIYAMLCMYHVVGHLMTPAYSADGIAAEAGDAVL
ncbi:transposase domain-containing protein [Streptomyces sp. CA2R106]|uniref:transposase domain-containing protein n=1 Tax=Streptomyces sp. CA2R106 TaxID=3120153 RepID=UPI0030081DE8